MKKLLRPFILPSLLLVSLLFNSVIAFAGNGGMAVILIDMQYRFYARGGVTKTEGLQRLVESQKKLLQWASDKTIPVIVFEYKDYEDTDSRLMEVIRKNTYKIITKTDDDGFYKGSPSRVPAINTLKEWDVDTVIVAGINGNACVSSTIHGAIGAGFNVITTPEVVGDLNRNPPTYPNDTWIFKDPKLSIYRTLEEITR